jgi:hypothetical protein
MLWHIHISPLRVAASPSEATSELKPSTYLRLQVCRKMESKSFVDDRKKNELKIVIRYRYKDAIENFRSLLPRGVGHIDE